MNRQAEQMWSMLLQAGLATGPMPATGKLESPWYVKVLLALSGWLAAVFLLGFVGVGFQFIIKSSLASFVTGVAMIGGAFVILRRPRNEFFEHMALAVSVAGQALAMLAIFRTSGFHDESAWILIFLLQVPLAIVVPNFVHRVFSSFLGAFSFSMTLTSFGAPYLFSGVTLFLVSWLWLNEFRYPKHMKRMRAIGYGLVLAMISLKGTALFGHRAIGWRFIYNEPKLWVQPWVGEIFVGGVTLYVVWQLLRRYNQAMNGRFTIATLLGTLLLCAVSMEAQGISIGMVIMLLGFVGRNRVLLGLGMASFLFYISSYYYLLDATLMAKAQTLLLVGLVLLAARWFMLRVIPGEKEARHV